jgi:hypothetical protein
LLIQRCSKSSKVINKQNISYPNSFVVFPCGEEEDVTFLKDEPLASGPHPRKDAPTPTKTGGGPMDELICYKSKLRAYAITEYGMSGWVDPEKLASKIELHVDLVCLGLDHLGYERYERSGGGIAYRQKLAGSPGKAKA